MKSAINIFSSFLLIAIFITTVSSCKKDDESATHVDITSFSPANGPVGTIVVVKGIGFKSGAGIVVHLGTMAVPIFDVSDTEFSFNIPTGATSGKISVSVGSSTATSSTDFTVSPSMATVVGTSGGAVASNDGSVDVAIPAGALAADQQVQIVQTNATAPNGVGAVYALSPEGLTFAKPIALTFHYTTEQIGGTSPALLNIAYKKSDGSWQTVSNFTVDATAQTITTQTTHFSDWTLLQMNEGVTLYYDSLSTSESSGLIEFKMESWGNPASTDTVLYIESYGSDTITLRFPYSARLSGGYQPDDNFSPYAMGCYTQLVTGYHFNYSSGPQTNTTIKLSETYVDGYHVGYFELPVEEYFMDPNTHQFSSGARQLKGTFRLKTP